MAPHYSLGLFVIVGCCFLEISSRPSNYEPPRWTEAEEYVEDPGDPAEPVLDLDEDSSIPFNIKLKPEELIDEEKVIEQIEKSSEIPPPFTPQELHDETTKYILQKIKTINEGLKKPQRQQINYNKLNTGGGYILDKDILEKIQKIIAMGKPNGVQKIQESNNLSNDAFDFRYGNKRSLQFMQPALNGNSVQSLGPAGSSIDLTGVGMTSMAAGVAPMMVMPLPYLTSIPAIVIPQMPSGYSGYPTSNYNTQQNIDPQTGFMTRQNPTLPFGIPWPLAPFFPVLVKDPLIHYLQGGSWQNWLEYGQAADVCNRKQKSGEDKIVDMTENEVDLNNIIALRPRRLVKTREGRAIKKRTIAKSSPQQLIENRKNNKKLFSISKKPAATTSKPTKTVSQEPAQDTKTTDFSDGDLRFPFGDFGWFGRKKPVAPSPGFFINRLKVRRGGVAIAGPGGVATAGRGGAAIVGPGGLAYTQPGGMAIAGPAAKVVAISSDADMSSIVNRLHQQSIIDGSIPRLLQAIPEGKVVATGPVIYYHPSNPIPL